MTFRRAWKWKWKKKHDTQLRGPINFTKSLRYFTFLYECSTLRTSEIVHHDRNGHYAYDAMISSLAKVMGLQSRQKQGP